MTEQEERRLFVKALNVMNDAIGAHADETPYKQILQASEEIAGDERLGVAVYAKDPKKPHDYYTVRFHDGRLELLERGKHETRATWKVSRAYLKEVARDPEPYVAHPEKLDLDWIKSRLGIH